MDTKQLMESYLPKWPQMLVWGEPVTPEQAFDIIIRTDRFFTNISPHSGGNHHAWNAWAREVLGLEQANAATECPGSVERGTAGLGNNLVTNWHLYDAISEKLDQALGHISTEYVRNRWASCNFIYGPHGWMHPDGSIGYCDNVGKYPEVPELLEEWTNLAEAFPYLDLTATFMNGESGEDGRTPVVSIRVVNGSATVMEPVMPPAIPERKPRVPLTDSADVGGPSPSGEQGLPNSWIIRQGLLQKTVVERIVAECLAAECNITSD